MMQAILDDDVNNKIHVKVKDFLAQHEYPPYVLNQEGVEGYHITNKNFTQMSTVYEVAIRMSFRREKMKIFWET